MQEQTDASQEQAYLAYANRPRRPGASSMFRGVSYRKRTGQWIAQLYWRGRRYFLGAYQDEREAAEVYNNHALKIIGPFAVVNDLTVAIANDLEVAVANDLEVADLEVAVANDLEVADLEVAAGVDGQRPEAGGFSSVPDPQQWPRARD